MIDGLKLTLSGTELRTLLESRVQRHEEMASRWTCETLRDKSDETEDAPLLPQHICENEAERHTWRALTLTFIRDHVEPDETYRLGAADLEYGELLPEKPKWVEQDEYEERTRIGFGLERLVKSVEGLSGLTYALQSRSEFSRREFGATSETNVDDAGEFRTTRIDVEDGPEIIKIERT